MSNVPESQVLQTAEAAFQYFQNGWKNGDFADFLRLITDDFEFSFPTGEHRGIFTGKTGRDKMIAKCRDDAARGARLNLSEPRTMAVDENTVIFEFASDGKFGDYEYHGRNIVVLEVDGKQLCGFREYFGDVDPQLFAAEKKDE